MAEATQYTFDLKEVASILIKAQGIHDGLWAVGFEIGVTIGSIGPNPADAKPGAMMQIIRVLLVRQDETKPGAVNVVDAAEVNPTTTRGKHKALASPRPSQRTKK
jgi:hypothetical protein